MYFIGHSRHNDRNSDHEMLYEGLTTLVNEVHFEKKKNKVLHLEG